MNYKKIKVIAFFLLLISGYVIGQSNKTALSIYKTHGYKVSIPLFKNSGEMSIEDREKIANSYRLNHDTQNAEKWYQTIVKETQNPLHYLYYAQALQSNEKHDQASQFFLMYDNITGESNFSTQNLLATKVESPQNSVEVKNAAPLNSEQLDYSPTYFGDQIIFVSNRHDERLSSRITDFWTDENFMTIWSASKKADGSLDAPEPFSKTITSKYNEGPICFNNMGDTMFFTRNDYNNGKRRNDSKGVMKLGIFTSVKKGEDWTKPKALEFNTIENEEAHPSLSHDGNRLYFSSDREGGFGGMDLYFSDFNNGTWTTPINLGENINTKGNDVFPHIQKDGTLYYASNGRLGHGGLDLYEVKTNKNKEWGIPVNMGLPYNSPKDDFALIMNDTRKEGFFTSARKGGLGKDDIYSFNIVQSIGKDSIAKKENVVAETKNEHIPTLDVDAKEAAVPTTQTKIQSIHKPTNLSENTDLKTNPSDVKATITTKSNIITTTKITDKIKSTTAIPNSTIENSTPLLNSTTTAYEGKKIEKGAIIELPNIYWDFNSSYLRNEVKIDLDKVVDLLRKYSSLKIELISHTDSRGSESYNQMLSQKRANSAVKYLITQGISPKRLTAKGYGETQLRNQCANYIDCSEEKHQYNRRTEIKVIKFDTQNMDVKYLENLPRIIDEANPNREWDWN